MYIMHSSIVCPTSPCTGIGGANRGFDQVVYFNPPPLGVHFKVNTPPKGWGHIYGNRWGFDHSYLTHDINVHIL